MNEKERGTWCLPNQVDKKVPFAFLVYELLIIDDFLVVENKHACLFVFNRKSSNSSLKSCKPQNIYMLSDGRLFAFFLLVFQQNCWGLPLEAVSL